VRRRFIEYEDAPASLLRFLEQERSFAFGLINDARCAYTGSLACVSGGSPCVGT
jgi:hypothetical protein